MQITKMWTQVFYVWGFTLFSMSLGENPASFTQSQDHTGHCQYIFTVSSLDGSGSCPGAVTERDGFLSRLTLLEALVSRLVRGTDGDTQPVGALQEAYAQVTGERDQLQQDKDRLTKQIQDLQRRLSKTSLEVESLRLKPCQHTGGNQQDNRHRPSTGSENSFSINAYQEMKAEVTEVPASYLLLERNQTSKGCGELIMVGEPLSRKKAESITGKYGVWLQDPDPQGTLYTNNTVWRIDAVGKDVRQLFAYEDMNQFSRGFPMKVLLLPEPVESTGATVYRGSLYYQRRQSRSIIRYDLTSESVVNQQDLPHASFHGQYPYSWGGYTDIDLAVDEQGLWAIYSTDKAKGAIVISKLDPESLEVKQSWETNIRKNTVANAFMICGRLYTVASYTAPDTTINYMFDTATDTGKAIAIPFKNKYRYNSMVDYNHALGKLFAWDNFNMVSYDLMLGRPGQGSR